MSLRLNIKRVWASKPTPRKAILNHLVKEFCDDYDMEHSFISSYINTDEDHLAVIVNYLTNKGYKVSTYKLEGVKKGEMLSWGLEFTDDCPNMLALRLKYIDTEG